MTLEGTLTDKAQRRLDLLNELYTKIVKQDQHRFSIYKLLKHYEVDHSFPATLQKARILKNTGTNFRPYWEWTSVKPNVGIVKTIMDLEKSKQFQYRENMQKKRKELAENHGHPTDVNLLSDEELIETLRKRGYKGKLRITRELEI